MAKQSNRGNQNFPTTHWSQVHAAAGDEKQAREKALTRLLEQYSPALLLFLVARKGVKMDEAEELVQGFIVDKIVAEQLLAKADQLRGRFRSFLVSALNNYRLNHYRDQSTQRRAPKDGQRVSDDVLKRIGKLNDPALVFEAIWAKQVITQAN